MTDGPQPIGFLSHAKALFLKELVTNELHYYMNFSSCFTVNLFELFGCNLILGGSIIYFYSRTWSYFNLLEKEKVNL